MLSAVIASAMFVAGAVRFVDTVSLFGPGASERDRAFFLYVAIIGVVALTGAMFCQIELSYEAQRLAPAEDSGDENPTYPQRSRVRNALAVTVAGLTCCAPLAIVGWIVAQRELKEIEAGHRDPAKRSNARTVRALSATGAVLWPLVFAIDSYICPGLVSVLVYHSELVSCN